MAPKSIPKLNWRIDEHDDQKVSAAAANRPNGDCDDKKINIITIINDILDIKTQSIQKILIKFAPASLYDI